MKEQLDYNHFINSCLQTIGWLKELQIDNDFKYPIDIQVQRSLNIITNLMNTLNIHENELKKRL